jgi:hypothetical protein
MVRDRVQFHTIRWNFLINKGKLFLEKDFVSWNWASQLILQKQNEYYTVRYMQNVCFSKKRTDINGEWTYGLWNKSVLRQPMLQVAGFVSYFHKNSLPSYQLIFRKSPCQYSPFIWITFLISLSVFHKATVTQSCKNPPDVSIADTSEVPKAELLVMVMVEGLYYHSHTWRSPQSLRSPRFSKISLIYCRFYWSL